MPTPPIGEQVETEPRDGDHLGALAAAMAAMEPDLRILAARVRQALRRFEAEFGDDPERYELARELSGAAALYDAAVGLVDALEAAVTLTE